MKSVLVTGGSGGIGKAICREFANRGYFVGVHYNKNKEDAEKLAQEIGGTAIGFDVKDFFSVSSGIEKFVEKAGKIDVLVNNAGVAQEIKPILDLTESEFDDIVSINLKGVFLTCKKAIPYMLGRGGCVINVSSMWGLVGASCEGVYSATKGAILAFTKSLAKEYASANIRVNAIAPGFIQTPMNYKLSEEDRKLVIGEIPLERAGLPEEVAKCATFLSEDGSFITGEVLNVSGGQVIV